MQPLTLETVESFDELGAEWDALAEASGNIFATREWLETWWRHFGGGELALHACRDRDGHVRALLPLFVWRRRGLRVLRFVGHGPSDLLGAICAPADIPAAQHALQALLARGRPAWHVFLGEQVLATERWSETVGGHVVRTTGFPIVRFAEGATWDDFFAARPSGWRSEVRRRTRKLGEGRQISYRLVESADDGLQASLDTLFTLHDHRWQDVISTSPFTGLGRIPFHREVAELTARRGWLRLWFLEVDGRPVAARYGWRFGRAHHNYQAGRERDWDRFAVGQLLVLHTLRSTLEEGVYEYRFLRGDESYKFDYATEDPRQEIVALGHGAAGRSALGAALAVYRSPLRERVRRLTGA